MTPTPPAPAVAAGRRTAELALVGAALALAFVHPLLGLFRFSLSNDLYSYIPLVPLTSAYLVWCNRAAIHPDGSRDWLRCTLAALGGFLALGVYLWGAGTEWRSAPSNIFALLTLSLVCFLFAAGFATLGRAAMRSVACPAAFLLFACPLPLALRDGFETFLQNASADAAHLLFLAAGTPVLRDGLRFQLPAMALEVAPECSGIHSTWVLLMTSVVGGYLFLSRPWTRFVLVACILPLALLRNGFRIFTIGQLCIHIGPQMIDSYIHRHGGPIFFALSLIPFLLLLRFLRSSERRSQSLLSP